MKVNALNKCSQGRHKFVLVSSDEYGPMKSISNSGTLSLESERIDTHTCTWSITSSKMLKSYWLVLQDLGHPGQHFVLLERQAHRSDLCEVSATMSYKIHSTIGIQMRHDSPEWDDTGFNFIGASKRCSQRKAAGIQVLTRRCLSCPLKSASLRTQNVLNKNHQTLWMFNSINMYCVSPWIKSLHGK